MNIVMLATSLDDISKEIDELTIDLFADKDELKEKENTKKQLLNQLLFYDEFQYLYENSQNLKLNSKLLYPFKEVYNEKGDRVFKRKTAKEYKDDVSDYLEELEEAYKANKIDRKNFLRMRKDAIELGEKQMDRIEKEEKEQEDEVDLKQDYENILRNVEDTKRAFIVNEIGEDSYQSLSYRYKNMQEIERKGLLYKTHVGLCKEMGISFDIDFTKYDIKDDKTVSRDGYCIKTKDINSIPYPLDTIILEQTYKLYIGQVIRSHDYTLKQKEELTSLLYKSLAQQKQLVLDKIKKRELSPYGC